MKTKIILVAATSVVVSQNANALQYHNDSFAFKLNGYGTAGIIETESHKPDFLGDWRVRAQANYIVSNMMSVGLVYAIDDATIDQDKYMREGFAYWEDKKFGRIEFGFTDSIARKLSVGLPDVGGLRVNDKPLFYKKIHTDGAVISDATLTTGRDAMRVNIASASHNGKQYGISVSGITDDYDYAIDAGLKIRQPNGKVKTAASFGASFMSRPDGFRTDAYTPRVTADWRAQASGGLNIQYNSWIFGLDARVIYDEKPIGTASDGLVVGTGLSYDILNYSVSLTYIMSDTGIWHSDFDNYIDHTVLGSFRYKYSANVDGWISMGLSTETPFISAGLRLTF